MRKPRVTTNPVANRYAAPGQRIIEVSAGCTAIGCLISLELVAGKLKIHIYRQDPEVRVTVQSEGESS